MTAQTEWINTNIVPLVRELPADLETPVSVYLKVAGRGPSFLLESITGGEQLARYSFIGVRPAEAYVLRGGKMQTHVLPAGDGAAPVRCTPAPDPLAALRAALHAASGSAHSQTEGDLLPRFSGGLAGFLGYEMIRFFEPSVPVTLPSEQPAGLSADRGLPDGIFLLADMVIAFDHAFGKMLLIATPRADETPAGTQARLDEVEALLRCPAPLNDATAPEVTAPQATAPQPFSSNVAHETFLQAVRAAREHIAAGDIFQVVLSQRLSRVTSASAFDIYRALRRLNPSPYMFFFDFDALAGEDGFYLIGASPEMHVRLENELVGKQEGKRATLRPIAGTRPRGKSSVEDATLERELLADPKERAEHVMLVDLARNDLGRVCQFGSIRVPEQMAVERYSHVMHIVSQVEGLLRPELDAFDLVRATFPAGTVSGAPKIRAMQIIHQLEAAQRGPYAGLVGYLGWDGSMDTCITIRTMVMRGQTVSVQAGAGIVADSLPENEYQETLNKARALALAVEMAEKGEGSRK